MSPDTESNWNERFAMKQYMYGKQPNAFLKTELDKFKQPGTILFGGAGEGRNAVYAARQGWEVDAFDISREAKNKALALAQSQEVAINYFLSPATDLDLPDKEYDAIGLIFFHLPPQLRRSVHEKMADHLAPGGRIILHAFSKEQLSFQSGGPKDEKMLYSRSELLQDFSDLEILQAETAKITLDEGRHQGEAHTIRVVAQKPTY